MSAEFECDADAVAIAFVQEGARDLTGWTARHPEQAKTLARLASDTHLGTMPADGSRVRELGLAALATRRPALTSLLRAARAKGLEMDEAARALEVPEGLLWKLHRRLIAIESVPQAFVERLAESVRRSTDEIRAYLSQPPALAPGASYRADDAPEVAVESFTDALAADPETTEAMRTRWSV
jgi:hypothetical protein